MYFLCPQRLVVVRGIDLYPCSLTSPTWVCGTRGADEAKLSQLLAMRVDLGSVKHHTAAVDYDNGSEVLYRSQIDDLDAEISHYYHLSAGGGGRTHAQNTSWKVAPFDEIAVYRSDPRHVTKLMRRSGGLGVLITLVRGAMGSFCGA